MALTATLASNVGTVNNGTVTFQVKKADETAVGSSMTANVTASSQTVSVNYPLPPVGEYNVIATYASTTPATFPAAEDKDPDLELSVTDLIAPSVPTGLTASEIATTSLKISWTASTDNVGVTKYIVYRDDVQVATISGTQYIDSDLTANTTYNYSVQA